MNGDRAKQRDGQRHDCLFLLRWGCMSGSSARVGRAPGQC
jgi:hypothetical protein